MLYAYEFYGKQKNADNKWTYSSIVVPTLGSHVHLTINDCHKYGTIVDIDEINDKYLIQTEDNSNPKYFNTNEFELFIGVDILGRGIYCHPDELENMVVNVKPNIA